MPEEGMITMSEFKTVVERFEENQKKIVEVINHHFYQHDQRMDGMMEQIALLKEDQTVMRADISSIKSDIKSINNRVDQLHEGQVVIRADLHKKTDTKDHDRLDKRVTRLEKKIAQ